MILLSHEQQNKRIKKLEHALWLASRPKKFKGPTSYLWYGFMCHLGITMLVQDWMGLDLYLKTVKAEWLDLHWIVGATISGSALLMYWYNGTLEVRYKRWRDRFIARTLIEGLAIPVEGDKS